ncbi:MAG: O-antigen ligase family protein [Marmoricola sp.]
MIGRTFAFVGPCVLVLGLTALATTGLLGGLAALVLAFGILALTALGSERLGGIFIQGGMLFAPIFSKNVTAGPITISDVLFFGAFMLLFPKLLTKKIEMPFGYLAGLGVLFFLSVLSSIAHPEALQSLFRVLRLFLALFWLPTFVAWWRPERRLINRMAGLYVVGQTISMMYGLALGQSHRLFGLTTHPNAFGICGVISVGLLFYLDGQVRPVRRPIVWGAALINIAGLSMSGSRAAVVAVAVMVVAIPIIERSGAWFYALGLTGAGGLLVISEFASSLGSNSALNRLLNPSASSAAGSDQQRSQLAATGWDAVVHHPWLGTGYFTQAFFAHNIYLQLAAAVGVFGLLSFIVVVATILKPLILAGPMHRIALGALGYFVDEAFNPTLWDRFAWAAMALVILAHPIFEKRPEEEAAEDSSTAPSTVLTATPALSRI